MIEEVLHELGAGYRDLACIISTVGPGSFTGLRIALATLHGLVLAHRLPLKVLTTTEAVAWGVADLPEFAVALDAGKGEYFRQAFTRTGNGAPIAQGVITLHAHAALAEEALPCFSNLLPADHARYVAGPNAAVLATLGEHLATASLADAMPYYIRPADAKIPAKPAWLV